MEAAVHGAGHRKGKRAQMKKIMPVIAALGLIAVCVLGFFGYRAARKYIPTKEMADLKSFYGVSGEDTAILYNQELQEARGLYMNGQTYLPISWVNEHINKRFYWDGTENMLVYALPDGLRLEVSLVDAGTPRSFFYAEVEFDTLEQARRRLAGPGAGQ